MSHNFVRQLIHAMWTTQNQNTILCDNTRNEIHAYISEIIKSKDGRLLLSEGGGDHIHCLFTLPPTISLSNIIQSIKGSTSRWINLKSKTGQKFSWQEGYASVSVQEDRKESVYSYIKKDRERHLTRTYKSELIEILKMQKIPINEKYLLSSTYSKVLLHLIWSTKNREPYLTKSIRAPLYEGFSRVINKNKGVVHEIGGIEDHVHLLIEAPKDQALSDLVREIKSAGTHLLMQNDPLFEWQTGYGGFSISLPTLDAVKHYIQNQEEHHKGKLFQDEWNELFMDVY